VAANEHKTGATYKWTATSLHAVQPITAVAAVMVQGAAGETGRVGSLASMPAEKGGLGINLRQKPLGFGRRSAGGVSGEGKGKETAAEDEVVIIDDQVVIIDDDLNDDDPEAVFENAKDENGWRRSYCSSNDDDNDNDDNTHHKDLGGEGGSDRGSAKKVDQSAELACGEQLEGNFDAQGSRPNSCDALHACAPKDFLPYNFRADDPNVRSRFLIGRAAGQGKELTTAEIEGAGFARATQKLNDALTKTLESAAEAYKSSNDHKNDKFRAQAYRNATLAVGRVTVELTRDNYKDELHKVGRKGRGGGAVGDKMLAKIEEYLLSGNVSIIVLYGHLKIWTQVGVEPMPPRATWVTPLALE